MELIIDSESVFVGSQRWWSRAGQTALVDAWSTHDECPAALRKEVKKTGSSLVVARVF